MECLNEITILSNINYNILIGIYPRDTQPGFIYDPYFKIFNSSSEKSATKVARISVLRPEYIYHANSDGKKDFKLSNKDIKNMIASLNAGKIYKGVIYNSAWEFMCVKLTEFAKNNNINKNYIGIPMPNYNKLK